MENFDKKNAFFGKRLPLKISKWKMQRRRYKKFRVRQPKMDIWKKYKGGPFGLPGVQPIPIQSATEFQRNHEYAYNSLF